MRVLVDGDVVVYRCAFACEHTFYGIETPAGFEEFECYADLKEFIESSDYFESLQGVDIKRRVEVEPVKNALNIVNMTLRGMYDEFDVRSPGDLTVYLTSKEPTFRDKLAVTKKYKGNRDDARKPEHYQAVRDFLYEEWMAQTTPGVEADDMLGMSQWEEWQWDPAESVIVTNDKDLDMIPGRHYNFVERKHYYVNQADADLAFCTQVLSGDSTDNIPGLPGIGPAKAAKMLAGTPAKGALEKARCIYNEAGFDDNYFNEQASLIWILREPDKDYNNYWEQMYGEQ